ncbi:MAG: basic amino acid ABC transporter substrate-binding protein [Candidatus Bipolaricaulota bacterium]|nr:basic amino acid ABC transporter substrate-binding protein [Candidatus Bipolaricaulota bacterium]MDW8151421.1 basic amino acid ABC transporter substrate-binding protein [Candidatus Bipolaricaulota bacterium]
MRRIWAILAAVSLGLAGLGAEKFIVASDLAWPPFEWVSAKGQYLGFDLDVMRMIAVLEGYEIEILNLAFDSIIPAVLAGMVDIGASGFTITAERAQVVDFSSPYWASDQTVLVRADSGLNIITALLPGRRVGAQRGTTGALWVEENLLAKGVAVQLILYETYPEAIMDLLAGRIDAVIQDQAPSEQAVRQYPGKLLIVGIIKTYEEFGFLVAKGDPKRILPRIERGMRKLKETGAWDNLVAAYFGNPLDAIEAAWEACIPILTVEKDPVRYAACLAAKVRERSP